jgi:lysophospholipase L1-like esterase
VAVSKKLLTIFALLLPVSFALGWVGGIKRWPPSNQLIALVKGIPTRPQQREAILMDVRPAHVTFVGDSITAEGLWNEYFDPSIAIANRGFPSASTADVLGKLPVIVSTQPRLYLVMLGVNDMLLRHWGPERSVANLLQLRQKILAATPGSRVVLQSTLECLPPHCSEQVLNNIRSLNRTLKAVLPDFAFLDLNSVLANAKGLNPAYTYDGIHLNAKGYLAWRELLKPILHRHLRRG